MYAVLDKINGLNGEALTDNGGRILLHKHQIMTPGCSMFPGMVFRGISFEGMAGNVSLRSAWLMGVSPQLHAEYLALHRVEKDLLIPSKPWAIHIPVQQIWREVDELDLGTFEARIAHLFACRPCLDAYLTRFFHMMEQNRAEIDDCPIKITPNEMYRLVRKAIDVDGAIGSPPDVRPQVYSHLADCPSCKAAVMANCLIAAYFAQRHTPTHPGVGIVDPHSTDELMPGAYCIKGLYDYEKIEEGLLIEEIFELARHRVWPDLDEAGLVEMVRMGDEHCFHTIFCGNMWRVVQNMLVDYRDITGTILDVIRKNPVKWGHDHSVVVVGLGIHGFTITSPRPGVGLSGLDELVTALVNMDQGRIIILLKRMPILAKMLVAPDTTVLHKVAQKFATTKNTWQMHVPELLIRLGADARGIPQRIIEALRDGKPFQQQLHKLLVEGLDNSSVRIQGLHMKGHRL